MTHVRRHPSSSGDVVSSRCSLEAYGSVDVVCTTNRGREELDGDGQWRCLEKKRKRKKKEKKKRSGRARGEKEMSDA